eukprot:Gregarina_sp_Poly_1__10141@NODE_693_length_6728_cov_41_128809_g523_i0_p2_GENE_NODE_693_length_6728_cov_41_128809_g523_i0NODE_693_length_6728_cov_41_128809_g523_i0_p2_ORF_typecomplete_len341_score41_17_NODE_693_length_6728_cov_41_128809_g523_i038844906
MVFAPPSGRPTIGRFHQYQHSLRSSYPDSAVNSGHRSQSSSVAIMGNYSSAAVPNYDKARTLQHKLQNLKRSSAHWAPSETAMGGTLSSVHEVPLAVSRAPHATGALVGHETLVRRVTRTASQESDEEKSSPASVTPTSRPISHNILKFKGKIKSLAGIGSPCFIAKQSNRMLSKLLGARLLLNGTSTDQHIDRYGPETLSINLLLSMTMARLSESQLLTATAKGYFNLISATSRSNKENEHISNYAPGTNQASGPNFLNSTRKSLNGSTCGAVVIAGAKKVSYEDLCFRAVAMLRSCDYPLEDIFCLFGVAAAHIDSVFVKLKVHDVLEKVYIALLQVR